MQKNLRDRMAMIPETRDETDEHPPADATASPEGRPDPDATTRKQGRPKRDKPSSDRQAAQQPATLVTPTDGRVPCMACPGCGRPIWPRTLRGANTSGEIPCECQLCGHRFGYTPPQVRSLS